MMGLMRKLNLRMSDSLYQKVHARAEAEGMSMNTLLNLWAAERVGAPAGEPAVTGAAERTTGEGEGGLGAVAPTPIPVRARPTPPDDEWEREEVEVATPVRMVRGDTAKLADPTACTHMGYAEYGRPFCYRCGQRL